MAGGLRNTHPGYRPDIDGLRAVAVLAVVAFHAFPRFASGGFVGVDVFFVISGYLISGIIFDGLDRGTFRFSDFYARRIRRIFPALTVILVAFLALGWLVLLPDEYRQLGKHIAAAAGFVSNIVLWKEAGYFDVAGARKPLLHLWSLGIEEQFYLVWPLLLVALRRRTQRLLAPVVILAVISFALNVALMRHPSTPFYMPFTRFWELLTGCILTLTSRQAGHAGRKAWVRELASAGGAVLILAAFGLLNGESNFPGWFALLPSVGAALVILAGPDAWINRRILSAKWVVFVGLISYPLYLWHWPLFAFARILGLASDRTMPALIVVSVILAWVTWRYVESAVRQRRLRHDVAILATALSLTGGLGLTLFATNGIAGRTTAAMASAALADIRATFQLTDCSLPPRSFDFCNQGRPGPVQAVVVGDSHANMLMPGLAKADPKRNWLEIGNDSCPPVVGVIAEGANKPHCDEKMKEAFTYLGSAASPRLMVISFFDYYAETTDYAADHVANGFGPSHYVLESDPPLASRQAVLALGLQNAIRLLLAAGKQVVLVIDVPELPFFPRDCIKRPFLPPANCHLSRESVETRQKGFRNTVKELQQEFPQISVFDTLPVLCDRSGCDPVGDGFSLYMDSHHVSIKGSEKVARALIAMIDRLPR